MKIRLFDSKIEEFIASLEKATIAKVLRTIDLLEMFGNQLGLPHSKKVKDRLFELRIRGKQEIRIFYTFTRNETVLLHGFIKKTNRIPAREIQTALHRIASLD
ncbi:MAG: putative phage protein Gp49 [Parcubacteria group bacterium Gr01-1014_33]|nr:MAG: putative phage protein Gp49 [Parcubacteria group bacterium Gr01-1014_33]